MERYLACDRWLTSGSELDVVRGDGGDEKAHLAVCPDCRTGMAEYTQVLALYKESLATTVELPPAVRARIAATAAEEVLNGPWWRNWVAPLGSPFRPILAGAMTAMVVLMGLFVLGRGKQVSPTTHPEEAVQLEMHLEGGKVHLAWTDGRSGVYKVRKSTDPRGLAGAAVHSVRGNSWVDEETGSSRIVFYQVD